MEEIPHFATVSYAFCKRFPGELTEEIFAHILNKALNHRMVDPKMIFMDGTHIKARANKKKFQKEKVAKAANMKLPRQKSQPYITKTKEDMAIAALQQNFTSAISS